MSEKNKNGNDHLSDFLSYKGNKMTDRERNTFERIRQKDPFTEEASEGLEGIDPSVAEKDITGLRKQLKKRTNRKQRILWYRIAASVAVLMMISSIFIIIEKRKTSEQLSYAPNIQQSKDLQTLNDQPVTETKAPAAAPAVKNRPATAGPEKSIKSPSKTNETESNSDKKLEIKEKEVSAENQDQMRITEAAEPDQVYAAEKAFPLKTIMVGKTKGSLSNIKGRVISSEDNQPVPGASITVKGTNKGTVTDTGGNFSLKAEEAANGILVANFVGMESKEFKAVEDTSLEIKLEPSDLALSEVVVVGYGAGGAGDEAERDINEYTPAYPVNGQADFNKYIRNNIRRPDTITSGQRVVVVLNFKVNPEGKIDSIRIIRSPGRNFSDEAVRLIREGPGWKPGEKNGKKIEDEVMVRIAFK